MATVIEAYKDARGNLHLDPSSAIIADIAAAMGRVGDEGGLTEGVARRILEKRGEIESAFADLDRLEGKTAMLIDLNDHQRRQPKSA
ncbi:hypothetical protein RXV95_12100 [Novosphingobium sp. ZN18A2]|uniref:hypothetical protein n=1 Tax=Novosphingobium sp. ZN18A2 TaxID=3079861 RepID=UPI0030D10628